MNGKLKIEMENGKWKMEMENKGRMENGEGEEWRMEMEREWRMENGDEVLCYCGPDLFRCSAFQSARKFGIAIP